MATQGGKGKWEWECLSQSLFRLQGGHRRKGATRWGQCGGGGHHPPKITKYKITIQRQQQGQGKGKATKGQMLVTMCGLSCLLLVLQKQGKKRAGMQKESKEKRCSPSHHPPARSGMEGEKVWRVYIGEGGKVVRAGRREGGRQEPPPPHPMSIGVRGREVGRNLGNTMQVKFLS